MFVQQTVSVLLEDFLLGQQRQPPVSQSFPVLANIKVYNFEAWWNMSRLTMLEVQSPIHDIDSQGNRFVRDWSERFVIGTWLPSIFIRSSEMDPPRWQSCTNLTAPFTQSPLVAMGYLFFFGLRFPLRYTTRRMARWTIRSWPWMADSRWSLKLKILGNFGWKCGNS